MTFSIEQVYQELKLLNETTRIEAKRNGPHPDPNKPQLGTNRPYLDAPNGPHFRQNGRELPSANGRFQKVRFAISEKFLSHLANIVVTLSAFRSNAEPWRLFLCTSDQRSVPIECDERRNSSLIRYAGSADGGLGKSICRLAADPKVDILKYIQKCA